MNKVDFHKSRLGGIVISILKYFSIVLLLISTSFLAGLVCTVFQFIVYDSSFLENAIGIINKDKRLISYTFDNRSGNSIIYLKKNSEFLLKFVLYTEFKDTYCSPTGVCLNFYDKNQKRILCDTIIIKSEPFWSDIKTSSNHEGYMQEKKEISKIIKVPNFQQENPIMITGDITGTIEEPHSTGNHNYQNSRKYFKHTLKIFFNEEWVNKNIQKERNDTVFGIVAFSLMWSVVFIIIFSALLYNRHQKRKLWKI